MQTLDNTQLRSSWTRFVLLGVVFMMLGLLALGNLLAATVASVYMVGIVMMIGGVGQVVHAFRVTSWGGFFFWFIGGVLYAVAGFIAFYDPLLAASAIALLLAAFLLASGAVRIALAFKFRPASGWGWVLASGIVTTLTGVVIAAGWPVNTLWLLGLVLALDLTFQGVFAIVFGLALKPQR